MNRNELAEELNVSPWDVNDWLLWGCPAEKFLSQWNFNVQAVKKGLKENKVKIKQTAKPHPKEPGSGNGWLNKRCPKCREKGFLGEKAGLLCTLGEIIMGRWYFRRVGYPCGHSMEIITWTAWATGSFRYHFLQGVQRVPWWPIKDFLGLAGGKLRKGSAQNDIWRCDPILPWLVFWTYIPGFSLGRIPGGSNFSNKIQMVVWKGKKNWFYLKISL